MAKVRQPNTICSNTKCTHGENGEPKRFYACYSCVKGERWRSYCCCYECYEQYVHDILESRAKNEHVEVIQKRTDISKEQILDIKKMDDDVVEEYVKKVELSDYFEENPDMSIGEAVAKVNSDIEREKAKRNKAKSNE